MNVENEFNTYSLHLAFRLPLWTDKVFVKNGDFELSANYAFQIPANTTLLARLSAGFLIHIFTSGQAQSTVCVESIFRTLSIEK